jgi:hypothetical protein
MKLSFSENAPPKKKKPLKKAWMAKWWLRKANTGTKMARSSTKRTKVRMATMKMGKSSEPISNC